MTEMMIKEVGVTQDATLTAMLHAPSREMCGKEAAKRVAMIICPGGGYGMLSDRESDPPAIAFLNMGLQVFVLQYPIKEDAGNKAPLESLARSVQIVRSNSKQWQLTRIKLRSVDSQRGHMLLELWGCTGMIRRSWHVAMQRVWMSCAQMLWCCVIQLSLPVNLHIRVAFDALAEIAKKVLTTGVWNAMLTKTHLPLFCGIPWMIQWYRWKTVSCLLLLYINTASDVNAIFMNRGTMECHLRRERWGAQMNQSTHG